MAGVVNVGIDVDARSALQRLKQVAQRGKEVERTFRDVNGRLRDAKGRFIGTGKAAQKASDSVGSLSASFGVLKAAIAAAGIGVAVKAFVDLSNASIRAAGEAQKLNAAFVSLTGSTEAAEALRNQLFQLSKTTPFKNEELLTSARRFLAVGVATEDLAGTINRVGELAVQSGQDLGRLGLIYAQVFAKGRLQGEENLQLLEAGVDLTKELSIATGLSGEALRDAMSKGQVSVDDFNKALKLATGEMVGLDTAASAVDVALENIGDNAAQIGLGFSNAVAPAFATVFNVINNAFDQLFPSLQSVQKTFKPLLEQAQRFQEIIEGNPNLVNAIATAMGSLLNTILLPLVDAAANFNDELDKKPQGLIDTILNIELGLRKAFIFAKGLAQILSGLDEIGRQINPLTQIGDLLSGNLTAGTDRVKRAYRTLQQGFGSIAESGRQTLAVLGDPTAQAAGTRQGSLTSRTSTPGSGKGTQAAQSAAERKRLSAQESLKALTDEVALAQTRTDQERDMVELQQRIRDINADRAVIGDELADKLIQQRRTLFTVNQVNEFITEQDRKRLEAQRKLALEQAKQKQQIEQIGAAIKNGITNAILDALDGTKSLSESLSGILRQLGSIALNFGIGAIGKGLKIPGFANGGRPPVNKPSIVGERGPELFVPRTSGTIVPNGSLGGGMANVTVNVDASGSNVQGDSNQASQLGKAIGAAVQAELVKQKRPGGLLAGV